MPLVPFGFLGGPISDGERQSSTFSPIWVPHADRHGSFGIAQGVTAVTAGTSLIEHLPIRARRYCLGRTGGKPMKSNDLRELSLDEIETVSGGADPCFDPNVRQHETFGA